MRVSTLIALIGVAAASKNQDIVSLAVKDQVAEPEWALRQLSDEGKDDEGIGPLEWTLIIGGVGTAGVVGKKVYDNRKKKKGDEDEDDEGEKEGGTKEAKKLFKAQIGKKQFKKAVK